MLLNLCSSVCRNMKEGCREQGLFHWSNGGVRERRRRDKREEDIGSEGDEDVGGTDTFRCVFIHSFLLNCLQLFSHSLSLSLHCSANEVSNLTFSLYKCH
ncbi:hypothetical protein L6452_31277 [Arctium lappa]|uniref:Uncharacterized protein n=1 Tax=Arctium lappa TaxID=4217 RepID=A0ACB8ZKG6_ARCLA|nr:hypothetical protein L6452_31277 [Arctium lappa]